MDCSLPGSSVHGISQARILECVAISFSRGSSQLMDQTHISYIPCIPLTWNQEISQEELHTSCRRNLPISQDQISGGGGLVAESCPTLCNPMDCSLLGSSVHGISQARILECVAISYPRASSQPRDRTCIFCVFCIGRQILYH